MIKIGFLKLMIFSKLKIEKESKNIIKQEIIQSKILEIEIPKILIAKILSVRI